MLIALPVPLPHKSHSIVLLKKINAYSILNIFYWLKTLSEISIALSKITWLSSRLFPFGVLWMTGNGHRRIEALNLLLIGRTLGTLFSNTSVVSRFTVPWRFSVLPRFSVLYGFSLIHLFFYFRRWNSIREKLGVWFKRLCCVYAGKGQWCRNTTLGKCPTSSRHRWGGMPSPT